MVKSSKPLFAQSFVVFLCLLIASPLSVAQVVPPATTGSQDLQEAYYPEVIHVQGDVQIEQEPEPGQPAQMMKPEKGMKIRPGARIKTVGKSQIDLGVVDKYQMRIKEKSDVIAGSLAFNTATRQQEVLFQMKAGSIYNRVQEGYLGKFEVETPTVEVTAIGTEYAVDVWGPKQEAWVGSAEGELQAIDKLQNKPHVIPGANKLEVAAEDEEAGKVVPLPDYELEGLQRELDKVGTGVDEDLDVRAYFILTYSTQRVREFLEAPALITNTNEPRRLQQLFIPTVRMLPQRVAMKEAILKNLKKIEFVCNYYADPRFTPHFLSFAGAIYHIVGADEQAVKVLEQVVKDYPDFMYASLIQCAIGIIYEENLKNLEKAREAYLTVLDKYPKTFEVEPAQAGLDRLGR